MAFGHTPTNRNLSTISDINMVPLIDVMLVLLVIFIVTAPLLTHAVKVDLPQASSQVQQAEPNKIDLSIRADKTMYWNNTVITLADLPQHMQQAAAQQPKPILNLHADRSVSYEQIALVMSRAAQMGLTQFAFVSTPEQ